MTLTLLMEVYRLAKNFVLTVFPEMDSREQRISTLAVMKMLIQLETLEAMRRDEPWTTPEGPIW